VRVCAAGRFLFVMLYITEVFVRACSYVHEQCRTTDEAAEVRCCKDDTWHRH
jgi:hypothetical protein